MSNFRPLLPRAPFLPLIELSIQLSVIALFGIRSLSPELNLIWLQCVIGVLFLSYVPGSLILFYFKPDMSTTLRIVFSVGLSLFIDMVIGVILLFVGSAVGMALFSSGSILAALSVCNLVIVCAGIVNSNRRKGLDSTDKNESVLKFLSRHKPIDLLFAASVIVLIIGSQIGSFSDTFNISAVILIVLVSVYAGWFSMKGFSLSTIDLSRARQAILIISVALIFGLLPRITSPIIIGYDIHGEYYASKLTLDNLQLLDRHMPFNLGYYNDMLSVSILPSAFSTVTGVNLIWIFKILYPLIFSITPLIMFELYMRWTSPLKAFLATFFLLTFRTFYFSMFQLARMEIAELFLALFLLSLILFKEKRIYQITTIVFGVGVVLSHYTTAYLLLFVLAFVLLQLLALRSIDALRNGRSSFAKDLNILRASFAVTVIIAATAWLWYNYTQLGSIFSGVLDVLYSSANGFLGSFFETGIRDPTAYKALGIGLSDVPLSSLISRYVQYTSYLFIIIALLSYLWKKNLSQKVLLSNAAFVIILGFIILPYVSLTYNLDRTLMFCFFFLSPLVVEGCIIALEGFPSVLKRFNKRIKHTTSVAIRFPNRWLVAMVVFFLILNFWVQSSFVNVVTDNEPNALQTSSMKANQKSLFRYWSFYGSQEDRQSLIFLSNFIDKYTTISADLLMRSEVMLDYGIDPSRTTPLQNANNSVLIYLSYSNLVTNMYEPVLDQIVTCEPIVSNLTYSNKIFTGAGEIYFNQELGTY